MFERFYRVLIMRRDEHDMGRHAVFGQPTGQAHSRQSGHLDVQEDHVRGQLVDQAQCVQTICRLGDDAQLGPRVRQLGLQVSQQVRFVVGDQGAGRVDGRFSLSGSTMRTVMPQG